MALSVKQSVVLHRDENVVELLHNPLGDGVGSDSVAGE